MLQHLDPDLLRAFAVVAETSSFTKAGERLFRTQAAISMQIKRLEDRIGKPLFVRGPQGTKLTSAGELLIHYARRILLLNDEALANLSAGGLDGIVRVGAPDDYAQILVRDVLMLFTKAFPDVQLELVCDNRITLVQEVREGRVDLAVMIRRPESSGGELLRREPLHWISSSDKSPHTSDVLPLALFSNGCVRRDIALRALKEAGRPFKLVLSSGTMASIIDAVSAGLAISVAEDFAAPAGVRRLDQQHRLPLLGQVDLVLHHAPGHQRRPATTLAKHIRSLLQARTSVSGTVQCAAE